MAALSWMESGIHQKMENDITTAQAFRGFFKDAFWTRNETVRNDKPLEIQHVFPSFILLGVGLVPSIIAFFLELLFHLGSRLLRHLSKSASPYNVTKRPNEGEMQVQFFFNE